MKSYEVRKVSAGSVFKLYFVIGAVLGLIFCIVLLIAGNFLSYVGSQLGMTNLTSGGPLQVGAAVVGVVVGSTSYGLASGLVGAIGAFIYNIFAAAFGGIVVKLVDYE